MQCPECGIALSNELLTYCEECGAKLPPRPVSTRSRQAAQGRASAAPARASASRAPARYEEPEEEEFHEDTNPGEEVPAKPPYEGPKWLEHVPAHSQSVLGVGLMVLGVVLGILPFFASVGPFWSTVVVAGGLLLAAREIRAAGQTNPAIDWVPEWLHPPALAVGFTIVAVALGIRMLGLGITPVLWALGAGLVAHEQWRKVLDGPEGYQRFFEPRLLLKGTRLVAVIAVGLCLLAMFLVWTRVGASGMSASVPVPKAPPELRVLDSARSEAYSTDDLNVYGWDQPLSVFVELLLLSALAVLALKPDEERPSWVRFVPLGSAVLSLIWGLVHMKLQPGPIVFLGGMLGVGFVGVVQAIPPKGPEPEYAEGEYGDEYGGGEYGDDYGGEGGQYDDGGQYGDLNEDYGQLNEDFGDPAPPRRRGGGGGRG